MKQLSKIDEMLTLVQKPARYINSELNSHEADMSADFSIVLCFPDIYEVGVSNLGLEILYHLNSSSRARGNDRNNRNTRGRRGRFPSDRRQFHPIREEYKAYVFYGRLYGLYEPSYATGFFG
jgi:hypothetical protein